MQSKNKHLLRSLVFTVAWFLSLSAIATTKETSLKTVYEGRIRKAPSYKVLLQIPPDWSDPGEYTKFTLFKYGRMVLEEKDLQAAKLENLNFPEETDKIEQLVAVFPVGPNKKQSLLAFANWSGGSQANALYIVDLSARKPAVIFKKPEFITEIRDYDGDGLYDLIKQGGKGEPVGQDRYSYDPYLIYKQIKKEGKTLFEMNLDLSKKWSEENHFKWQGSVYDDKTVVNESGEIVP